MIPSIGIDLKTILNGVDCDPTSYKNGEPCRMKVDMKSVLGFDFGITAQKCFKNNPELSHKHYATLNCIGEMCGYLLKPCTSNSDCGNEGHCKNIDIDANNIINIMGGMGLMSEGEMSKFRSTAVNIDKCTQDASTASLSYGWRVMMGITKWADGYFGNGVADSRSSFGVCLPKGIGEGNNDIFKDIGDSFGE
jgi:hypothetical protein